MLITTKLIIKSRIYDLSIVIHKYQRAKARRSWVQGIKEDTKMRGTVWDNIKDLEQTKDMEGDGEKKIYKWKWHRVYQDFVGYTSIKLEVNKITVIFIFTYAVL